QHDADECDFLPTGHARKIGESERVGKGEKRRPIPKYGTGWDLGPRPLSKKVLWLVSDVRSPPRTRSPAGLAKDRGSSTKDAPGSCEPMTKKARSVPKRTGISPRFTFSCPCDLTTPKKVREAD